jgi:hypothetical protein
VTPTPTGPRCPRHGRELNSTGVCALCRAEDLETGRERRHVDDVPRCPLHDVELNTAGVCRACRAEDIADDNPRRPPDPPPDTASTAAVGAALVRAALRRAGIDPHPVHPTTERTTP